MRSGSGSGGGGGAGLRCGLFHAIGVSMPGVFASCLRRTRERKIAMSAGSRKSQLFKTDWICLHAVLCQELLAAGWMQKKKNERIYSAYVAVCATAWLRMVNSAFLQNLVVTFRKTSLQTFASATAVVMDIVSRDIERSMYSYRAPFPPPYNPLTPPSFLSC